jgi:lipocalin
MLFKIFFVLFFVFASCKYIPATISSININNYLGHWIQVYGSPTNVIFQGYGTCITADYGVLDNGNISVINSQLNKNKELEQITGYGYYKNMSEPGKLTVHLEGVSVDSPYWIIKLGEIIDNEYQYTIITTPSCISLWVLIRNMNSFTELYDTEITDFLNEYNFKYDSISQDDCIYK